MVNHFFHLKVGWTSNNHGGGFVRISLVPDGQHQDENIAINSVLKYVCYGHDTREGRTKYGDCKHPCNARGGCQYPQGNVDDSNLRLLLIETVTQRCSKNYF